MDRDIVSSSLCIRYMWLVMMVMGGIDNVGEAKYGTKAWNEYVLWFVHL